MTSSASLPAVTLLSCVGGGPMARLAAALQQRGWSAHVSSLFGPDGWRSAMTGSAVDRWRARAAAFVRYPAQAVLHLAETGGVAVATTNPFVLPLWLSETRAFHGRPVLVLAYDLFPDALEAAGALDASSPLSAWLASMNRRLFQVADGVVFIGRRMADHARSRYGEPRRWVVIETGASAREFDLADAGDSHNSELESWCHNRFVVAYIGNLGHVHDWSAMMHGVPMFLAECQRRSIRAGFLLAASGPGAHVLQSKWQAAAVPDLRVLAPLNDRCWTRVLRRTSVSVATLRPSAARTSIPSKVFSSMAAGNAILAVCPADSDLADIVSQTGAGVVTQPGDESEFSQALLALAQDAERRAALGRAARAAVETQYDVDVLARRWEPLLLEAWEARKEPSCRAERAKRLVDVIGAAAGLAVTAPILATAAIAVAAEGGLPVLFRQTRPGLHGRPFELAKFRTMRSPRVGEEGPQFDGMRTTTVGRILRATSVDELPSLLNVLLGDMSLVGPRPLLMRYLERYDDEQRRRHELRPGLTGWAQINGRNAITWTEKFRHDVWYVDNQSLLLDMLIMYRTIDKVLRRQGINLDGHATMPEFMGGELDSP